MMLRVIIILIANNQWGLLQGGRFAKGLTKLFLIRLTMVLQGRCSSCPPFIDKGSGAQRSGETSPSHPAGQ